VAGVLLASGGLAALMGARIVLAAATEIYAVALTRRLRANAPDTVDQAPPPQGSLLPARAASAE
jgi:hypothetical protein